MSDTSDPTQPTDEELLALLGEDEEATAGLVVVEGSSGTQFHLINMDEGKWFELSLERYMEQYHFENIADLQDLDRLLGLEALSYRYSNWLLREADYDGNPFDEKAIREHKDKVDKEVRAIKVHMGIGRKTRVESEQQSVADYLSDLLGRANEFGVHRDEQNAKILDLFMELKKLVGLFARTDEEERKQLGVSLEDIFVWITDIAIPEFDKLDDHFRVNQRTWIKDIA